MKGIVALLEVRHRQRPPFMKPMFHCRHVMASLKFQLALGYADPAREECCHRLALYVPTKEVH